MKKLTALILTLTMLFSLCAIPVAAETETDNRVWFDLNGNSKFFVKKVSDKQYVIGEKTYDATSFTDFRTNFKDYLPGVDFAGYLAAPTGDFETDQPLVDNPKFGGSMFLYTTDKNTNGTQYATPDFKTGADGHLYWTINDIAYRINPNANVIKINKKPIDVSALVADEEKKSRYESINKEAVIDVEDGRYKNVGLLIGLSAGATRNVAVTLVYENESPVEKEIDVTTTNTSSTTNYHMGILYLQNFTNTTGGGSNAVGGHSFVPVNVEAEPSKKLVAIKIKDKETSATNCVYVVSAWGVEKTLAEFVADIDAAIENATTVVALEAIDVASIENEFNCDLTEQKTAIANKIAEIVRVENLTEGNKTYIDFVSQVSEAKEATKMDIFSDYQTIVDYAVFNTALNTSAAFNADMYLNGSSYVEADSSYTGETYKNKMPDTTTDGTPITGNEGFYRKGFASNKNNEAFKNIPFIYDTDSIKNIGGKSVEAYHYNTDKKSNAVTGKTKRTTKVSISYAARPVVKKIENTANGEYYYLKDGERTFKLGPAKSLEFSPNAVASGQTATDAFSVNAKGAYLDLAIGASNINNTTYSNLNIVTSSGGDYSPAIALQAVQVKYASKTETYYIPVWNSVNSTTEAIRRSIMYAPKKYDEAGNEIAYTATDAYKANTPVSPFKPLSDISDIKKDGVDTLTMDDIVCPEGTIVAGEMDVASFVYARQGQFYENYPAVATASIPLKNEEVISFTLAGSLSSANAAAKTVKNAIALSSSSNTSSLNRALIPVEIKGAKEEYVYYLYVGRLANYATSLIGATLRQESMSAKIAEINEQLTAAETKADIISALDVMKAFVDSSNGAVLVKDFDIASATDKLNAYILAELEATKSYAEVEVIDTEVDGYVETYGIDATTLKAVIAAKKAEFAATRLEGTVYAPIEMKFLNDLFATRAERGGTKDTLWFDGTKPYNAYLGYDNSATLLPMTRTKYSQGAVISVDGAGTGIDKLATLVNGRYVLPIGGVPYRLGAMTEGVVDANAFEPGAIIANIEGNILFDRIDENFTLNNKPDASPASYTVNSGKFPVDIPNVNKINVVTTTFANTETNGLYDLYAVDAIVHLDDGSTVGYVLLTPPAFKTDDKVTSRTIEEAVVFVPKNSETDYSSYSAIKGAIGGEVKTLNDMQDYDISDIKLPSAPTVKAPGVSKYNYIGLTGVRPKKDVNMYYDHVILPESTQEIYKDIGYKIKAYASSFELTVPEGRTITAVEFTHDSGGSLTKGTATECYTMAVGGIRSSDATNAIAYIPATVEGLNDYQAYVRITRNCHYSAILGMTAETTGAQLVSSLNTLMANATADDIELIESLKESIDGNTVLYSDLDEAAREKYEAIAEAANLAGTISLSEGNTVTAKINNITRLAGKKYTLIVAFYDEGGNLIKAVPKQYLSEATKEFSQTLTVENVPENTASVKGFIWKDFDTLIPLGTEAK